MEGESTPEVRHIKAMGSGGPFLQYTPKCLQITPAAQLHCTYLPASAPAYLLVCLPTCQCTCLPACMPPYLPVNCLPTCQYAPLPTCQCSAR